MPASVNFLELLYGLNCVAMVILVARIRAKRAKHSLHQVEVV